MAVHLPLTDQAVQEAELQSADVVEKSVAGGTSALFCLRGSGNRVTESWQARAFSSKPFG